jgi:hypothetical protein
VPSAEDCVSCRRPTTGRGKISGEPLCSACKSKPWKAPTLANLGSKPGRRHRPQCRICLAAEPLKNGICKDRAACELRQPPLELDIKEAHRA